MKKKTISIMLCATMLITSMTNVFAANTCTGTTTITSSDKITTSKTYCSYATSDYTVIATNTAKKITGQSTTTSNTASNGNKTATTSQDAGATVWDYADGKHYVYYRGSLSWSKTSHAEGA